MSLEKPFLDFYGKHSIIPVKQEINADHFHRRYYLYQTLGLQCGGGALSRKNILEVGPGTGDNAVVTGRLYPTGKFSFMDGNTSSIAVLKDRLKAKMLPEDSSIFNIDFAKADVSEMQDKFDLVLCEGTIPGQTHPVQFASKLFTLVAGGGKLY